MPAARPPISCRHRRIPGAAATALPGAMSQQLTAAAADGATCIDAGGLNMGALLSMLVSVLLRPRPKLLLKEHVAVDL